MSALVEAYRSLARVLDGLELRWYVFGAQAVAIRGAPRATQDIDVTLEASGPQIEAVLHALEEDGIQHRYPEIADTLLSESHLMPLIHPNGFEIDLVLSGSGLEDLAHGRATRVEIEGTLIPFAQATDLVVMKILAGRGKDMDDVLSLLASGTVDLEEARDLLAQLEEATERIDLVEALERSHSLVTP